MCELIYHKINAFYLMFVQTLKKYNLCNLTQKQTISILKVLTGFILSLSVINLTYAYTIDAPAYYVEKSSQQPKAKELSEEELAQQEKINDPSYISESLNNAELQKLYQEITPKSPEEEEKEIERLSQIEPLILLYGGNDYKQLLGCINCNPKEYLSIWNEHGPYGSPKSQFSIWNKFFEFGSDVSALSPWSLFARTPPIMIDTKSNVYGLLTLNTNQEKRLYSSLSAILYAQHDNIRQSPAAFFEKLFPNNKEVVVCLETLTTIDARPFLNKDNKK